MKKRPIHLMGLTLGELKVKELQLNKTTSENIFFELKFQKIMTSLPQRRGGTTSMHSSGISQGCLFSI